MSGYFEMAVRALLYRRPSEPHTVAVKHGSQIFAVRLRRHRRARRYTLRIDAAVREAVITLPPNGTIADAREFAERHGGWIAARLGRLPKAEPFAHGSILPLRGIPHRIEHRPGSRGTVWVETSEDGDKLICVAGAAEHVNRRVHDFLKKEARADLMKASLRCAEILNVKVTRLTVRDQASRWGSCTVGGSLSYSWRLILAPAFVLDYLAAHEVAHLVEMNHSDKFWKIVHRICPATDRAKTWLDTQGNALHGYGVTEA